MLLDINAYVGHWPFQQLWYNTCKALLGRMDQFGVDVSVISNLNGVFYKNTQSANEELYDEIKSDKHFSDRMIPFAVLNPIYAGWRDDLETCVTKMRMKGIRLYPKYHDYEITDPSLVEMVKRARDRGLPVAFDQRMYDSRTRSWLDIGYVQYTPSRSDEWTLKNIVPIIREVPDAKYIIVNIGNVDSFSKNLTEEDIALFKKANVVFDTSGRTMSNLGELLKTYGTNKFAFGSHSPILDCLTGRLRIESLRAAEADEATKELLRSGNAKRILGV